MTGRFITCLTLLFPASFVFAATLHVPTQYESIQEAIDAASSGDSICVANGTYLGPSNCNLDLKGKTLTICSKNGPDTCLIDCEQTSHVIHFETRNGESSFVGFSVRNARSRYGAVTCSGGSPLIRNCEFIDCYSLDHGAALYVSDSRARIEDCRFIRNHAVHSAGAVYVYHHSDVVISNCYFLENYAGHTGGAIWCEYADAEITGCAIVRNRSEWGGGGITIHDGFMRIRNCTIAANTSNDQGGAIKTDSSFDALNTILWCNAPDTFDFEGSITPRIEFSAIQGGYEGLGNISADPLFSSGNFHLAADSPCIDAGRTDATQSVDLDRSLRPQGESTDIGAYEYPGLPMRTRVTMHMPAHSFHTSDPSSCTASVWNVGNTTPEDTRLFVLLELHGAFLFAPSFGPYDFYERSFPNGMTIVDVLPDFYWPEGIGSGTGAVWYAALVDHDMTKLCSEVGIFDFDYSE